jgi:hypothetical protein
MFGWLIPAKPKEERGRRRTRGLFKDNLVVREAKSLMFIFK